MSVSPMLNDLLILLVTLILLIEIYRKLRQIWLCPRESKTRRKIMNIGRSD